MAEPDGGEVKPETPTTILLEALEDFGVSEACGAMVIWINEAGQLCWRCSPGLGMAQQIGMLDCVKSLMMRKWVDQSISGA